MNVPSPGDPPSWDAVIMARDAALAATSHHAALRSINHVYEALETLRDGGTTITFEAVGRFCIAAWGTPKTMSIHNSGTLGDIVRLATAVQKHETRGGKALATAYDDRLLARLTDRELRSEVQILLIERRSLASEVTGLRKALKRVQALQPVTAEMAAAKVETLEQLGRAIAARSAATIDFTAEERAAVAGYLKELFERQGCRVHEPTGEIVRKNNLTLHSAAFHSALRKILESAPTAALPAL